MSISPSLTELPDDAPISARLGTCAALAWEIIDSQVVTHFQKPELYITDGGGFDASIGITQDNATAVWVDAGCVLSLDTLWHSASRQDGMFSGIVVNDGQFATLMTNLSLVWLFLHEYAHLVHYHLDLVRGHRSRLSEGPAARLGLSSQAQDVAESVGESEARVWHVFELQADHLAMEGFFGKLSDNDWEQVRLRGAAVAAVMLLIDKSFRGSNVSGPGTHPLPDVRLFSLFGLLLQLWLYEHVTARSEDGSMKASTIDENVLDQATAYTLDTIAPLVEDVGILCNCTGATQFYGSILETGSLFRDITRYTVTKDLYSEVFETEAARESIKYIKLHAALIPLTAPDGR